MSKSLSKDHAQLFVLVHYHESNEFAVMRLKEDVTQETVNLFQEDLSNWNKKQIVNSKFGDTIYPAQYLQFGRKYSFKYLLVM